MLAKALSAVLEDLSLEFRYRYPEVYKRIERQRSGKPLAPGQPLCQVLFCKYCGNDFDAPITASDFCCKSHRYQHRLIMERIRYRRKRQETSA